MELIWLGSSVLQHVIGHPFCRLEPALASTPGTHPPVHSASVAWALITPWVALLGTAIQRAPTEL